MVSLIFALAILLIVLLFVGVGLLIGRRYVWSYSVAKVAALVVTAPLTLLLATLSARGIGGLVNLMLVKTGALGDWASLLEEVPALADAIAALIAMVLAPVLFYVIFMIVRPILYKIARTIVKKIVTAKSVPTEAEAVADETVTEESVAEESVAKETESDSEPQKKKEKEKKKKPHKHHVIRVTGVNPLGMLCGAAGGLLMALILLSPFLGFLTVADDVVGTVAATAKSEAMDTVDGIADAAVNNPAAKTVNLLGGKLLYTGLTTYRVGNQRVSLTDETAFIETVGEAVGAVKNKDVARADAATAVRGISDSFAESSLIPAIAPEILGAATDSWEKGESFHGIKKPAIGGGAVSEIMNSILSLLATSDCNTIKTDVDTILDVVAILVEEDALGSIKNPMALIGNEKVTGEAIRALLSNERTKPLVGDVAEIGLKLMGNKLAILDSKDGLYDDFVRDAADMINRAKAADDVEGALLAGYTELLDNYALDATEDSMTALVAQTATMEVPVKVDGVKAILANTPFSLKDGKTVTLTSREAMAEASLLVSMDQIHFDSTVVTAEEAEVEAKALATVLTKMVGLMDKVQGSGFGSADSIREMGAMMDALAATKTIGKEETDLLLMGMLQSDKIHGEIGFSVLEATEVAQSIGRNSVKGGYVSVMSTLGNTIEIVQMSSKNENINEKMDVLLQDLTSESATVLQTMAKPSVMTNHGVPERSAEASANMMSSMFGNLADAKASGMSEEEYQKESKAVADMTNLAMKASASSSDKVFGEGGVLNSSAEEYVGDVFDSKVMSKTLVETVYPDETDTPVADPLNTQKNLNESETVELMDALNNQWANATEEEKADPEYKKTYYAIGALMNVDSAMIDTVFVTQ